MPETVYTHENTERGRHFVLFFGTRALPAGPITWEKTCIFSEEKSISFTKNINTTSISRGCDTPGATPIQLKDVTATGMSLQGNGFYRGWEAYKALRAMHESVEPVLVKMEHFDAIDGGKVGDRIGTEQGTAHFIINQMGMPTDGPTTLQATLEFVGMTTLTDEPEA